MKHVLAVAVILASAGWLAANPCARCATVRVKKAPVKVVKRAVEVIKEVQAVVTVFQPVYLTQVTPAPAITYNLSVPAPPPAPTQQTFIAPPSISASVLSQSAYSVQNVQQPQRQQQQVALSADQRLDRLEAAIGQLCDTLKVRNTIKAEPVKEGIGIPRVLATKCAACHSGQVAAQKGGGFVLFDRGTLAPLTQTQLKFLKDHVERRTMPPKGNKDNIMPLDDAEAAEILEWAVKLSK